MTEIPDGTDNIDVGKRQAGIAVKSLREGWRGRSACEAILGVTLGRWQGTHYLGAMGENFTYNSLPAPRPRYGHRHGKSQGRR